MTYLSSVFTMKNLSIFLTLWILLIASALLKSVPRNTTAQANATDYTVTEDKIKSKITDFKAKHPKFAAVIEGISNLDLKETVKSYIGAKALQKLLKFHAKNLVEETVI